MYFGIPEVNGRRNCDSDANNSRSTSCSQNIRGKVSMIPLEKVPWSDPRQSHILDKLSIIGTAGANAIISKIFSPKKLEKKLPICDSNYYFFKLS
jgi:hypothetical protein